MKRQNRTVEELLLEVRYHGSWILAHTSVEEQKDLLRYLSNFYQEHEKFVPLLEVLKTFDEKMEKLLQKHTDQLEDKIERLERVVGENL